MNFTSFDSFFDLSGETSPLMMLVWILPVILFVFYGQQIQLYITSGAIKKEIKRLDEFRTKSRFDLLDQLSEISGNDHTAKIDRFLEHFTIMPVDMDPAGIVNKIQHTIRSREDYTCDQVCEMLPDRNTIEINRIQTILEITSTLQMIHKIILHMYLTAKKQNNYPLILPLQMALPFVMEQAEAMRDAISALKDDQPLGDGIGPMVVGRMMLDHSKETVAFQTVLAETDFKDRHLLLLKAEGPGSTVGRPSDALDFISSTRNIDVIIMIDAALKLEGEDSAAIAEGFGAAIGGIGTEKFYIEEFATNRNIPVFSIVVKETVREAITLMTEEIANQAQNVKSRLERIISENTKEGQSVLIIGVGNTVGVSQ